MARGSRLIAMTELASAHEHSCDRVYVFASACEMLSRIPLHMQMHVSTHWVFDPENGGNDLHTLLDTPLDRIFYH